MSASDEIDRLEALIKNATRERDRLYREEWNRLSSKEPKHAEAMIKFRIYGSVNGQPYDYAAIRVGKLGKWFRTGSTCPPLGETWEELLRFIRDNGGKSYSVVGHFFDTVLV